jgi:hypothetical protein
MSWMVFLNDWMLPCRNIKQLFRQSFHLNIKMFEHQKPWAWIWIRIRIKSCIRIRVHNILLHRA